MPEAAAQQTPMLTKLRRKFVFTNMLFVVLILAVVWVLMVVVGINQRASEIDESLSMRVQMVQSQHSRVDVFDPSAPVGEMPEGELPEGEAPEGAMDPNARPGGQSDQNGQLPVRRMENDQIIATSVFVVQADGTIVQTVENPLSLDDDSVASAIAAALEAYEGNGATAKGSVQNMGLRYIAQNNDAQTDTIVVAFASEQYLNQSMTSMMQSLGIASVIALLAFFVLSMFLSRWALGPVQRAWNQQQQFVADASHELKTPLTVIMANNSILMSNPEASVEEQMQWVESTQTEAKMMQGLVNDMLYLARSESEEQQLVMERVDLSDLARSAALQFEAVAFERGITLEDDIADDVAVQGNAEQLNRVLGVLLDNACKYADEGGRVLVTLQRAGAKAQLKVNNTGTPIPPEDLPHLFDRFYRADKARTRDAQTKQAGGFGLGLAIAHNVVSAHGGNIEATSSLSEGTTFTVTLPV